MIARLLEQTSFEGTFDDLKEVGTARLFPVPRVQFEGLTFATPSGRIEVRSDRLAEQGHPAVPVAHADEAPEEGRLRLLTPAGEWLMNSSYGNDPKIAAQLGPAKVHLNARDVARRKLAQGDIVRLSTKAGQHQPRREYFRRRARRRSPRPQEPLAQPDQRRIQYQHPEPGPPHRHRQQHGSSWH